MSQQTLPDSLVVRRRLITAVRELLEERVLMLRHNMDEAQEEANSHQGAMASRYDTFKEEAQDRKNSYAVELQKTLDLGARLADVRMAEQKEVDFGAIVTARDAAGVVSRYFFFAAVSTTPLAVEGVPYYPVSLVSPIGATLRGKRVGDEVVFRGHRLWIVQVA